MVPVIISTLSSIRLSGENNVNRNIEMKKKVLCTLGIKKN